MLAGLQFSGALSIHAVMSGWAGRCIDLFLTPTPDDIEIYGRAERRELAKLNGPPLLRSISGSLRRRRRPDPAGGQKG